MAPLTPLLFEKQLGQRFDEELVSYCHPHDLIALVTDACDVLVYRINGQLAFTIRTSQHSQAKISAVNWKPDGRVLAIAWSDGKYGLYSGENGKLFTQSSVRRQSTWPKLRLDLSEEEDHDAEDEDDAVVVLLGWTRHRSSKRTASEEAFSNSTTEALNADAGSLSALAKKLTQVDVTEVMPKLSAIPSHGVQASAEGSKFSTQVGTDSTFEVHDEKDSDDVDVLLVCTSDKLAHVLLDDTVKTGSCRLNEAATLHCSHSNSPTHALSTTHLQNEALLINFVDLPLEMLGSPLIHVVATNTKRIQNLIVYIKQTIRCLQHDFITGLQLPTRLLNSFQEMLTVNQEGDPISNLYHLAMTGDFTPTVLEWLVDILKETNLKRWDQAINAMYSNVQDHVFINLLPALDRLSIAITTLRGHAQFHEGTGTFDVHPNLFTKVLDGVDSLRAVAQKIQLLINTEYKRFRSFSKWLRIMIEVGVAGPGSKGALEVEDREVPNLGYASILAYIKDTMTHSQLTKYMTQASGLAGSLGRDDFFAHEFISKMSYESTKSALQHLNDSQSEGTPSRKGIQDADFLLNLPAITAYLAGNVKVALDSIAAWQGSMLTASTCRPVHMTPGTTIYDMRLTPAQNRSAADHDLISILTVPPGKSYEVGVWRIDRALLAQGLVRPNYSCADIGEGYKTIDAKLYHEDHALVLAYHRQGNYSLFDIRHVYVRPDGQEGASESRLLYLFPSDAAFIPEKLLVGGREGKMVCVVLGNQGWEWKVIDIGSAYVASAIATHSNETTDEDDDMQIAE